MPQYEPSLKVNKKKKKKKQNVFVAILSGLFPWKGDKPSDIIRKIVFLVSLIVLVAAAMILFDYYYIRERQTQSKYSADVLQLAEREPTSEEIEQLPSADMLAEYAAFYAANPDFVGWITVPDTRIDYPVVQTTDNDYYLTHDFYKNEYAYGTPFADYEGPIKNNEIPNNTILYGHNLDNSSGFTQLTHLYNLSGLKESCVIDFNTLYSKNKYKIFSVMLVNTQEKHGEVWNYQNHLYFSNRQEFNDYVGECLDRTMFFTGVDLEYGDELLTLSTCDFSTGLEDLRCVVVARKVRDNESTVMDTDAIVKNDNVKYFDAYYEGMNIPEWQGRQWDTSIVKGLE